MFYMIDPLEEPNPEWDIFPHQPTKAMSETIQRYTNPAAETLFEAPEGELVYFKDHQSDITREKAENAALKRELEEARAKAVREIDRHYNALTKVSTKAVDDQMEYLEEMKKLRSERDQLQSRVAELEGDIPVSDQIRGQISGMLKRSEQYQREAEEEGERHQGEVHSRVCSVLRELDRLATAFAARSAKG
jgi:chromosome segregation ATPase